MEKEKIKEILNKIIIEPVSGIAKLTETLEFFRMYIGESNSFYRQLKEIPKVSGTDSLRRNMVESVLTGYLNYLQKDLEVGLSFQKRIQVDTVSDFLDQANSILNDNKLHPASACVIIGAALEEFLRLWVEDENLLENNLKKSIDSYAKLLRDDPSRITKQDYKDITSWAGLRNSAAHGLWNEVEDRQKVVLMFQGVNLFMRTYWK